MDIQLLSLTSLAYLTYCPSLSPMLKGKNKKTKANKTIMGACLCSSHVSSSFLLHLLLLVLINRLFFSFTFLVLISGILRHFALHRSWLHVLVEIRSFRYFLLSFIYSSYTAHVQSYTLHSHTCTPDTSTALYFHHSLCFFTSTSHHPADRYVFQYYSSSVANMNVVLSHYIDGIFPSLVSTFPSHTVDTGWPSLYGIFATKPCPNNTYLCPRVPRVIHYQQLPFFLLRHKSSFRLFVRDQ